MAAAQYREYPVPPAVMPFITCIWSLEGDGAPRERILPDGCVELVFHFRDQFCTHFANGKSSMQPESFVVGQMNRFIEIEPRGRIGFVAVRFNARGAYRFLPGSLKAAASAVVDVADIWKTSYREWGDSIASATTMSNRVATVEALLFQMLRSGRGPDAIVDRALQLIAAHFGELKIASIASQIGTSERELGRRFENSVGLSPKQFSRVYRFRHALHRLRTKRPENLTETAVACGYYDQAHFNHEFRELTGIAPGELFKRSDLVY